MIQRIQTVYLFLVLILNILAIFFAAQILEDNANLLVDFYYEYHIYFIVVAALSMYSIMSFKKRILQLKTGILNLFLNFVALGFLVYWLLILPGEIVLSEKGIGLFVPFISIVFIILAQNAIKKDEKLVKSADRFR